MCHKGKTKKNEESLLESKKCCTYLIVLAVLVITCLTLLFQTFQFSVKFKSEPTKILLPIPSLRQKLNLAPSTLAFVPRGSNKTAGTSQNPPPVTASPTTSPTTRIDPAYEQWRGRVSTKLTCLRTRRLAFYLYHVRKAAGTTVRDVARLIAFRQRIPFYETEGIVLNEDILNVKELFTIITLRDPISRIISLYWYEHVGWFSGILKQPQKCKTLQQWIDAWRDGSSHKQSILAKFPINNYVEIENYYVKLLIGYNSQNQRALTSLDLEKAKSVLRKFDLLLITEWLNDETEHNVLHSLYQNFYLQNSNSEIVIPQKVKGDLKLKSELSDRLASNEVKRLPDLTLVLNVIST